MKNSCDRYRDEQRIDHMLAALEAIVRNSIGVTRDALFVEDNITKVLMYDLIVLGEAANRISEAFASAHPEIEWSEIAALRHKLVHDYAGVDYGILWEVVSKDVPLLLPKIKAIHSTLPTVVLDPKVGELL